MEVWLLGVGVRRVAGVVYTVTADVLARLDELDASKPATKQMPCLATSCLSPLRAAPRLLLTTSGASSRSSISTTTTTSSRDLSGSCAAMSWTTPTRPLPTPDASIITSDRDSSRRSTSAKSHITHDAVSEALLPRVVPSYTDGSVAPCGSRQQLMAELMPLED